VAERGQPAVAHARRSSPAAATSALAWEFPAGGLPFRFENFFFKIPGVKGVTLS
jgi:hypothetical protein